MKPALSPSPYRPVKEGTPFGGVPELFPLPVPLQDLFRFISFHSRQPLALVVSVLIALLSVLWSGAAFAKAPATTASAPYVSWAGDLSGPAIRLLFIAPKYTLHDATELARRLKIDYETVSLWNAHYMGYDPSQPEEHSPGESAEETDVRIQSLLRKKRDVIVLAGFSSRALPASLQAALLDRVSAGTGLVLVNMELAGGDPLETYLEGLEPVEETEAITRGAVETIAPAGIPTGGIVRAWVRGDTRVVRLAYPGDLPRNHCLIQAPLDPLMAYPGYFDNGLSLAAKAVCWAAHRNSDTWIAGIEDIAPAGPAEDEIPPDLPPEDIEAMRESVMRQPMRPFLLKLNQPAPRAYQVRVQLRQPDSEVQYTNLFDAPLPKGADTYPLDLLVGPGEYFVDAWIADRRGVIDWHTQRIILSGWPDFDRLEVSKNVLMANDKIDISLVVRPFLSGTRSGVVHARATDTFGRVVAQESRMISAEGGRVMLPLGFADLISPLIKLDVYALDGAPRRFAQWELSSAFRQTVLLPVRLPRPAPDSSFWVSGDPVEYNARFYLEQFREWGASGLYAPGGPGSLYHAALLGLPLIPEVAHIVPENAPDGLARRPCLSDPVFRNLEAESLKDAALRHWAGGTGCYSLGDGNALSLTDHNLCQSPDCLAGFQTYLEDRYGDLNTLNTAWETDFHSWDAVRPSDLTVARTSGRLAPYIDFRRYMEQVFTEFHVFARERIRETDRGAIAGFRLRPEDQPLYGYHFGELVRRLDFLALEADPVNTAWLRGWEGPEKTSLLVADSVLMEDDAARARWLPWHAVLNGLDGVWVTRSFGDAGNAAVHAALRPDGQPSPSFASMGEAWRQLGDGLGALLLRADREPAPVAVFHSPASRHFNDADPGSGSSSRLSETAFIRLFEALGYAPEMVDATRLNQAPEGQYKLLALPLARALDDAELAAIRAFYTRGGALIADAVPGVHDGHGLPRTTPPLDDLFGHRDETLTEEDAPVWREGDDFPAPALLLNQPLSHEAAGSPGLRELAGQLLAKAGCAPPVALAGDTDQTFQGGRFRLRYGAAELTALLADPAGPPRGQVLRLEWEKDLTVYDAILGLQQSRRPRLSRRLAPGEAMVLAALPYRVEKLTLMAPATIAAGHRLPLRLAVLSRDATPGDHLVRLEVIAGNNRSLQHYSSLVTCKSGLAETYIPLAINEIPGKYRVTARDILTGATATALVEVAGFLD